MVGSVCVKNSFYGKQNRFLKESCAKSATLL